MSRALPPAAVLPRWDAVVIRWALSPDERSALLAEGLDGPVDLVETYRVDEAESRMRLIIELGAALDEAIGDEERVRAWLRRRKLALGNRTPIQAMAMSAEWTRRFIASVGELS